MTPDDAKKFVRDASVGWTMYDGKRDLGVAALSLVDRVEELEATLRIIEARNAALQSAVRDIVRAYGETGAHVRNPIHAAWALLS